MSIKRNLTVDYSIILLCGNCDVMLRQDNRVSRVFLNLNKTIKSACLKRTIVAMVH